MFNVFTLRIASASMPHVWPNQGSLNISLDISKTCFTIYNLQLLLTFMLSSKARMPLKLVPLFDRTTGGQHSDRRNMYKLSDIKISTLDVYSSAQIGVGQRPDTVNMIQSPNAKTRWKVAWHNSYWKRQRWSNGSDIVELIIMKYGSIGVKTEWKLR